MTTSAQFQTIAAGNVGRSVSRSRSTTGGRIRCLDDLRLGAEERAALARQGFVAAEYRRGKGPYYRLHFRLAGRQTTRYLGRDPAVAQALIEELADLQSLARLDRELGRRCRQARRLLRATKERLAADLERAGYHYHGLDIRRRRGPSARPADPAVTPPLGQLQPVVRLKQRAVQFSQRRRLL